MYVSALVVNEFDDFALDLSEGQHAVGTHTYELMLVQDLPAVTDTTDFSTPAYTEVSGGGYARKPVNLSLVQSGGKVSWVMENGAALYQYNHQAPGFNCVAAVLINSTTNRMVAFSDLTQDFGITPVDTNNGNIVLTYNSSGIVAVGKV